MLAGTELVLVRHGETEWNVQKRLQGSRDSPLTARGVDSARQLGRRLAASSSTCPLAACYSSDLGRAWRTAELVTAALPGGVLVPVSDSSLRERSFGCLEGKTAAEAASLHPEAQRRMRERDWRYEAPGGGESRAAATERVMGALRRIAEAHAGQRVLVVTHSAVLSLVATRVSGLAEQSTSPGISPFALPNTALNVLAWHGEGWRVRLWGDVGEFAPGPGPGGAGGGGAGVGFSMCVAVAAAAAAIGFGFGRFVRRRSSL